MLEQQESHGDLFLRLQPRLEEIEVAVQIQAKTFDPGVEGYITYLLGTSGKRLRPTLALLVGGAVEGRPTSKHLQLGIILELIHIATLVHDDIMDGAEIRRQMPTVCARWGNALSVLLGDCLFAHALRLSTEFDDTTICRKVAIAAGDVCSGEILQTQRRFDLNLSREAYFRIIEMKTASLFGCAAELASYLSSGDTRLCGQLRDYGLHLGTAYQIYDDCLDLVGNEQTVGKTLGTDLAKGKLTLPLINLIEQATDGQKAKLNRLLLANEPVDSSVLAGIADYEGSIESALDSAKRLLASARGNLDGLDENEDRDGLEDVTYFVDDLIEACR